MNNDVRDFLIALALIAGAVLCGVLGAIAIGI